jgi:hypothetical protein
MVSTPRFQDSDFNDPRRGAGTTAAPQGPEAVERLVGQLGDLLQYAARYLAARIDGAKVQVRNLCLALAAGFVGLTSACALLGTACVLLVLGCAQGIGELLGGRMWAGYLIVGLGALTTLAGGGWMGLRLFQRTAMKQTVDRYERQQHEQPKRRGRDAAGGPAGN